MYPTADIELDASLPTDAEFWVPEPDEIDDYEGFGMFQDVWPLTDVSVDEAIAVAAEDGLLCQVAASLARDAADFDILAAAVETGSVGEDDEIATESMAALEPYLTGMAALESLEAGVAGLVYALSAAGMFPAASCRGHADPDAWSAFRCGRNSWSSRAGPWRTRCAWAAPYSLRSRSSSPCPRHGSSGRRKSGA